MAFGPFTVKSPTGTLKIVTTGSASAFVRTVGYLARPHWRIAHRMLEVAWMSDADHAAAEYAFRHALEMDRLLIE